MEIDKTRRHVGVAAAALAAALELIELHGGVVESHPEDTDGRKTSGFFLCNGTVAMFERLGF